ncbi:MAG TPA: DUF1674 domain-containing protein [Rhodanobacteraceae bacterium]|nr:DUF1674 domain-containing protein [Rhodanobacteraceae bacterium]
MAGGVAGTGTTQGDCAATLAAPLGRARFGATMAHSNFGRSGMEEHDVDAPPPDAVPEPASVGHDPRERATPEGDALDPTRYGDWEKNGRCIDF